MKTTTFKQVSRLFLLALAMASAGAFAADDTIKVGVLHSLSGTMAISETTLKDTMLMLIDEQNKKAVCWARSSRLWSWIRRPLAIVCRKGP